MRLLVSVRDAHEAQLAAAAGADVIDAKDPAKGALGPVPAGDLEAIAVAIGGKRVISAAVGDVADDPSGAAIEAAAGAAARAGVGLAKLGMGPGSPIPMAIDGTRVLDVLRAEAVGDVACGLVLGAYADAPADARYPYAVLEAAAQCGAAGVLLDTVHKDGRTLFDVMPAEAVAAWATAAHSAGLFVALAGSLGTPDVSVARDSGADVIGVRGAVCIGGRTGTVSPERVRALVRAVSGLPPGTGRTSQPSLVLRTPPAG